MDEKATILALLSELGRACANRDVVTQGALAAELAQTRPGSPLLAELASHLAGERRSTSDVYAGGEGFRAFIGGGGNVPLYEAVRRRLNEQYAVHRVRSVLDIGFGDGHALPVELDVPDLEVDAVEPSRELLRVAKAPPSGMHLRTHDVTIQEFMTEPAEPWDLMQATFCLHSIPKVERAAILAWVRRHARRFVIVEFDVPALESMDPAAAIESLFTRYDRGLREYAGREQTLVAQEFLIPLFLAHLGGGDRNRTHEQPIDAWADECEAAGLKVEERKRLAQYWWGDAYAILGTPRSLRV